MTVMNKKEDRLFEEAMERIDLKYVEEPPEHGVTRTKSQEPEERKKIRTGWLVAAAAALICLVTGGVILANSGIFRKNGPGYTEIAQNGTNPQGGQADHTDSGTEDPQNATLAVRPGMKAFGLLYEEFLDEQAVEKSNDPIKKAFFKEYAGSYLADDWNLYVLYKETGEDAAMKVKAILEEEAGCEVTFLTAKYSLQDLYEFKNQFSDVAVTWSINGHENWTEALIGVGIDQKNNCLRVTHTYLRDSELEQMKASLAGIPCEFEIGFKQRKE